MSKILVIEDEAPIRDELIDWLRFEGYDAFGAANGRIGINSALSDSPDLIICDIRMPEMDGFAVLQEARRNPKLQNIPILILTASVDPESFKKGMELGADDYLMKPFTHGDVLNAVKSRLSNA